MRCELVFQDSYLGRSRKIFVTLLAGDGRERCRLMVLGYGIVKVTNDIRPSTRWRGRNEGWMDDGG